MQNVLFVYGNEPISTAVRKLNLLHNSGKYNVHLIFWHRVSSNLSYPFTSDIPSENVFKIELENPGKGLFKRLLLTLKFTMKLMRVVRAVRPLVVHAFNTDMLFASWIATFMGRSAKLIYDVEDTMPLMLTRPIIFLQRWVMQKTSLLFVTSPCYLTKYFKPNGILKNRTRTLFVPNAPEAAMFADFTKKQAGPFVVGYIGTFRGECCIINLFKTARRLNEQGIPLLLLFAGTGVQRPLVESLCEKYVFASYHGPYDYRKDILDLYGKIDVIFSLYDLSDENKKINLPCRLSEAIVCELPIIVPKDSYTGSIVEQAQIGYAIQYDGLDELTETLRILATSPEEQERIAQNCRKLKVEHIFESYSARILFEYELVCRQ